MATEVMMKNLVVASRLCLLDVSMMNTVGRLTLSRPMNIATSDPADATT